MNSSAPGSSIPVSVDDIFDALADRRRRRLLRCLLDHDGALNLQAAAGELACADRDAPARDLSDDEIERVYASLHHVHVPRLEDAGLLAHDRECELIESTPWTCYAVPYLTLAAKDERLLAP